jgi:SAM-dependent methyltransferase
MYSIRDYLAMMQDPVRIEPYRKAIAARVTRDDIVLDLGAGQGIMSFLALQAGARKVYAVERDPIINLVRQVAQENNIGIDRLVCIQADSERVELPEPVDLIVHDIRGSLPVSGSNLRLVVDARSRFLKPGGAILPDSDIMYVAPIESNECAAHVDGWRNEFAGVRYDRIARVSAQQWFRIRIGERDLLASGVAMAPVDFRTLDSFNLAFRSQFTFRRDGSFNAIGVWFESYLAPGIVMSLEPGGPPNVYGHSCFPLDHAHPVRAGETVEIELRAHFIRNDHFWSWRIALEPRDGSTVEERHAELRGVLFGPLEFERRSEAYRPQLTPDGALNLFVLQAIERGGTLREIASDTLRRFPNRFPDDYAALTFVGELAASYG